MLNRSLRQTLILLAVSTLLIATSTDASQHSDEMVFTITRTLNPNDGLLWSRALGDTISPNGILSTDKDAEYGDEASAEIIQISCADETYLTFIIHREDNIKTTIFSFIPFKAEIRMTWGINSKNQRAVTLSNGDKVRYVRSDTSNDQLLFDKSYRDRATGTTLREICALENIEQNNLKLHFSIYDPSVSRTQRETQTAERINTNNTPKSHLIEGTVIAPSKGAPTNPYQRKLTTLWAKLKQR